MERIQVYHSKLLNSRFKSSEFQRKIQTSSKKTSENIKKLQRNIPRIKEKPKDNSKEKKHVIRKK
jgi:hypothetical protein